MLDTVVAIVVRITMGNHVAFCLGSHFVTAELSDRSKCVSGPRSVGRPMNLEI